METLSSILSDLNITDKHLSPELDVLDFWYNNVSESLESYQSNQDDIHQKNKEIERLKDEEQSLFAKIKDREKEFAVAKEKLIDLQVQHASMRQFDEDNFGSADNESLKLLEYKMKLFGIDVRAHLVEPTVYQAKILFDADKFVIFNCDLLTNTYDLQAIEPMHRNFENMREFLKESGDITGFLCHARKMFRQRM